MEDRVLTEHRKHRVGPGWSRDDGLSIVELLVALVIVMIAFAALASTLIASFASIRNSEARVRAVALANELVEEMAEIPYDRLGLLDADVFPEVDFEGEELVMLAGDEQKVVEHQDTIQRDGRGFEVERWVTWFEEDGGQDLKRIVATVTWQVGGNVQTVRSETLRSPDAQDLLDLEVSVDVTSNATAYDDVVALREPGESNDLRSEHSFRVTATMGVVPAEFELRFRDRWAVEVQKLGPTAEDLGERIFEWTVGGTGENIQFRHGRHAFTVYATGADDRVASATGTLRFYQNVRIDPGDNSLVVLQNGSAVPTDGGGNPVVVADALGVLCGPVSVQTDVHGMTGGEATPTAVEGGADDEVEGGLTLHLRRESDVTDASLDDWGWDGNEDPVVMRLLQEEPFGGTYIGEMGVDYLPDLAGEEPVAVTLRADRRAQHPDFDMLRQVDVAVVEVVGTCP